MTHTQIINGKEVIFETLAVAERFEHSTEYFMDGYTGDKLTHTAIGSFAIGSDDFEEISYIKEVEDANKRLNEVDFFDLMQRYRMADMTDQEKVVNRFDAVKEWIRQNYA